MQRTRVLASAAVVTEEQQQHQPGQEFTRTEKRFWEPPVQMIGIGGCSYRFESLCGAQEYVAATWDSCRSTDGPDDTNRDLGRPVRQMHEQPATRGTCCARPSATLGRVLPVHKHLAITRVGIHKQSWIGELFVRRHGGAKPDDFGALDWNVCGAERVGSTLPRIVGAGCAARRIAFVEKPRTIEARGTARTVRHDRLGTTERRSGELDQCQCNNKTRSAQYGPRRMSKACHMGRTVARGQLRTRMR